MKDRIGKCSFCGQLMTIQAEDNIGQEEVDARVTKACTCSQGLEFRQEEERLRRIQEAKEKACKSVEELFEADYPDAATILYACISLAAEKKIRGIRISLGNDTTAVMNAAAGKIKVERIEKKSTSRSTDFE
ncbi:MAG: hypothetical protein LUG61_08865 [Lachnospiraceae bacterium]|nr:hypothetical protein [Lachnospiraceae bacterium]